MPTMLIVEDEIVLARNLAKAFTQWGFEVHHAASSAEARRLGATTPFDVALLDLRLPDGSGLAVLDALIAADADLPVIMMTAYGSVAEAVSAMQRGARDFVQKPLELDEIRLKIENAIRGTRERREISYYRHRGGEAAILGESPAAERLRQLVARLARVTGSGTAAPTILLLGPTGSGKGHVARALHASGGRSGGPLIEINCTAMPENLIESELFGYEKGAFTDAKTARAGLVETAEGGTLFLDEIGHVSPALQAKLLKVIEEKVIRRIGATASRKVDVQIVAATNRDLEAAVEKGEFRDDLYQRLRVAVIRIPPLREREGDAVLLARALLREACARYGMPPRTLAPEAEAAIRAYPWPGNVRELGNTMERVVLFSDADPVPPADLELPTAGAQAGRVAIAPTGEVRIEFPDAGLSLESVERAMLAAALQKAGGNQSAAARLLGVTRDTVRSRIEKYGF
jgi:two-component system, NtrC family, response regulator AtoC